MARVPVFVSAPTDLNDEQNKTYEYLLDRLRDENLERRALGRSDYPTEYPLKEVMLIARHCSGGIILGFNQANAEKATFKPGTPKERVEAQIKMPTPWNNLEAGMLFALKLPLMVFREDGISGGVFDTGVTDVFIHRLPIGSELEPQKEPIKAAIQNWVARVRDHYRNWN